MDEMAPITINGLQVLPQDIRYDNGGVYIGDQYIPYQNPRLEFARVLSMFKVNHKMNYVNGSMIHYLTHYNDTVNIGYGCTIGGAGFGYEQEEDGTLFPIPHLGRVVIEDNVTIHNNVCIDRAVLGDTVIGYGSKIDNLVHVAHNVKIGKNCLIVAGTVLGGSCEIGEGCFIGINASIKNKVKVGNNVIVGMGAVVTRDVPDGVTVIGNPAKELVK